MGVCAAITGVALAVLLIAGALERNRLLLLLAVAALVLSISLFRSARWMTNRRAQLAALDANPQFDLGVADTTMLSIRGTRQPLPALVFKPWGEAGCEQIVCFTNEKRTVRALGLARYPCRIASTKEG